MTEELYAYTPDYAVHPGEYLDEVLESRGIKKREFAECLGISVKHLSEIINRKKMVTAKMAIQLEQILGISASIWNNLNADYALFQARVAAEAALEHQNAWMALFPILDLKKLGFLPAVRDEKTILKALLNFFGIASPKNWDSCFGKIAEARYRKSDRFIDNNYHIAAWLRAGELWAQEIAAKDFSKEEFQKNLKQIRNLTITKRETFEPAMKRLCAEAGIALVFVPEFGKTHISGATRWLTQKKALIIMSLRYRSNDHFWFTFFHESAHILLHGKKEIFIDDKKGFTSEKENEANLFSKNMLIPEAEYGQFIRMGNFYEDAIKKFAERINIHPGIVVGRLQFDEKIKQNWHNKLKEQFGLSINAMDRKYWKLS